MTSYGGWFSDGRTAGRRDVLVSLAKAALHITELSGEEIAVWTLADLRFVDEPPDPTSLRLRNEGDPDARLVVIDARFLPVLQQTVAKFGWLTGGWRPDKTLIMAAGGTILLVAAFVFALPVLTHFAVRFVPMEWERSVGTAVVQQMTGSDNECREPAGRAVLDRLTERLVATTDGRYELDVRVYDDFQNNAFAAPGGYIVIYKGLFDFVESGDEVAGVLAHEMGHVLERHSTQAVVRELGLSALLSLMGGAKSVGFDAGNMSRALLTNSYSREAEAEADAIAVATLNAANIKGDGYADFFKRLARDSKGGGVYSTHPANQLRADAALERSTGTQPAMSADDWKALKGICPTVEDDDGSNGREEDDATAL